MPTEPTNRAARIREWLRHAVFGCEPYIEADTFKSGTWLFGWCRYCGCRHAKAPEDWIWRPH